MRTFLLFVGAAMLLIISCNPATLHFARKQAGDNWRELEKVIERYKQEGDMQKMEAVYFLMKNMPFHSFPYSDGLVEAKDWFRLMRERPFSELPAVSDSIAENVDINAGLTRIWDIQVLDSAYLCENIDMAFKVWREQPWGKNVSFDIFCRYILPYRIGDEIPEEWRKSYYEKYNHLLDDFRSSGSADVENPIAAYKHLVSKISIVHNPVYSSVISPATFPHIGPEYAEYNAGNCRNLCDFLIYVCRALGIPCALNQRLNIGHYWNSYWDDEGNEYVVSYYPGIILKNEDDKLYNSTKLRVFRNSYEVNRNELIKLRHDRAQLPFFFRIPLFEDVTSHYTGHYEKHLLIPDSLIIREIRRNDKLFLCSSQKDYWGIEDYTVKKLGKIEFCGVQRGIIMCVAVMDMGTLIPVSEPFMLDAETSEIKCFRPDGYIREVILKSKYPVEGDEEELREMMRNGVFEGSATSDFKHPDTLAIIQVKPDRQISRVKTYRRSKKPYKYVRYVGPKKSYCGVAEVCFYDTTGNPVRYERIIGTSSIDPERTILNVYDRNPSTSYDYYYADGGWCGLELSSDTVIDCIDYTPRNRVNYIYAGDEYELFYYDDEWKSLGRQIAESDSLVYTDVPDGALLYLKNHSSGVKEMIFTYENGIQLFHGYGMEEKIKDSLARISHTDWDCRYSFLTPESDWADLSYDDSLWESGYGPFGLKQGCSTQWSSKNLFVRYYFGTMKTETSRNYSIKGYISADAEIYLNGILFHRTSKSDPFFEMYLPYELLRKGENVVAVKCMNADFSESAVCDIMI